MEGCSETVTVRVIVAVRVRARTSRGASWFCPGAIAARVPLVSPVSIHVDQSNSSTPSTTSVPPGLAF